MRRQVAERPCHLNGEPISLSASIGVAAYPEDGRQLDALLSLADKHMYRAKAEGRNRVISDTAEPASRPLHTLLATLCREEGWKEKRGEG